MKTRYTEARQPKKRHNYAFASNWEVYDTYKKTLVKYGQEDYTDDTLSDDTDGEEVAVVTEADKQMVKLLKNIRFQVALIVIERLLANNNYNEEQKRFRSLYSPNPLLQAIDYTYRLDLLWTFANSDTKGKSTHTFTCRRQQRQPNHKFSYSCHCYQSL